MKEISSSPEGGRITGRIKEARISSSAEAINKTAVDKTSKDPTSRTGNRGPIKTGIKINRGLTKIPIIIKAVTKVRKRSFVT